MLALPDYIVLDFLEWISQNYPRKKMLLDLLLRDKKLALSYAEEYLSEEYSGCKNYGYLSNDSNCSSMALYCITGYDAG